MNGNVRYNMPGPIDVPQETNSGLDLLPTNRTLIALPFKGKKGPRRPEEIPAEFAQSTKSIMEYIQPEVKVDIKTGDPDRPEVPETIRFRGGVTAFAPKAIKKASPRLRKLEAEFQASASLIDCIDKNAQFRKALDDPKAREAMVGVLNDIISQLKDSLPQPEAG